MIEIKMAPERACAQIRCGCNGVAAMAGVFISAGLSIDAAVTDRDTNEPMPVLVHLGWNRQPFVTVFGESQINVPQPT